MLSDASSSQADTSHKQILMPGASYIKHYHNFDQYYTP